MCPELQHAPTLCFEQPAFLAVTLSVAAELRRPKSPVCLRQREGALRAAVPEAPVNEDGDVLAAEDNVRSDARDPEIGPIAAHSCAPQLPAKG
jgi:hypothetical protein